MQHDEVIWQTIRHNHCSFMSKIITGNFCRNPYNVTGICNRSSCPLANSRYATIRDHDGVFFLYIKTIERAHKPNDLWEKIKLPRNYEKAMEIIDTHMQYWPKFLVHKTKQRLTKMTQYRIRMRKLQLKVRETIVTVPRKETKREARREKKAEKAALLDKNIEKELLERLKKGVYGDIYNYPQIEYDKVLEMQELPDTAEEELEPESEFVEGDFEEEEDMEDSGGPVMNKALIDDDDDDDDDGEDFAEDDSIGKNGGSKGKRRILIEVEHESGTGGKHKVQKMLV